MLHVFGGFWRFVVWSEPFCETRRIVQNPVRCIVLAKRGPWLQNEIGRGAEAGSAGEQPAKEYSAGNSSR